MGLRTEAAIKEWQERAGIEPATGGCEKLLEELSCMAFKLIKAIELERSGIRRGDGCWTAHNEVTAVVRELGGIYRRLDEYWMGRLDEHWMAGYGPFEQADEDLPL